MFINLNKFIYLVSLILILFNLFICTFFKLLFSKLFHGPPSTPCGTLGVRNAPVAKCNTSSDHTVAKRPPTALKRLEIKLRPVGEVGRNSEHLALDYSESNISHFCFHMSYKDTDWWTEKG